MISFVIPAHNEKLLIRKTIESVVKSAQELGQDYEVIVVADSCTDTTAEISAEMGANVVLVGFRQIGRTRNAGAEVARGELLVFLDADTLLPAETLASSYNAWCGGAVGGGALLSFEGELAPWTVVGARLTDALMKWFRLTAGCYIYCSREAFRATGGFNDGLYALEELEFSWKLRRFGRIVIVRERIVSSGRNLGAGSGWRVLKMVSGLIFRGPKMLRTRDRLSYWYGDHRGGK